MTFAEYAADVRRTYAAGSPSEGLAMCALGLCGEAGEVADHIKKHLHHKHPLDKAAVAEELGDVLFYIVGMAHEIGVTLGDVVAANVAKRQKRYPHGFDPQCSMERGGRAMKLTPGRLEHGPRDGYSVWIFRFRKGGELNVPESLPVGLLGSVHAVVGGDSACFELVPDWFFDARPGFNAGKLPLTGYTSLRAAILALAHACGYPDAELPEGWTP